MKISSFFSGIEATFKALAAKVLTPQVQTVIAGQIAQVNVTNPDSAGTEKQSIVAKIIAELFGVGEAIAHALVKIVFDELTAKAPAVLAPIVQVGQQVADQAVSAGAQAVEAKAEDALKNSPFKVATPPAPSQSQDAGQAGSTSNGFPGSGSVLSQILRDPAKV